MLKRNGGNKKQTLFYKSLVLMGSLMAVIVAAATFLIVNHFGEKEFKDLQSQIGFIASLQADTLSGPLWDFDDAYVTSQIAALSDLPDFQAAWIEKKGGKKSYEQGKPTSVDHVLEVRKEIVHKESDDDKAEIIGQLVIQISLDGLKDSNRKLLEGFVVSGVFLLIVILGFVAYIISRITNPLKSMTLAMGHLASGELATDIPAKDRKDEVGRMAAAVEVFKENALRVRDMESERIQRQKDQEASKKREMTDLANTLRAEVGSSVEIVMDAIGTLERTFTEVSDMVRDVDVRMQDVNGASTSMASNVQSVAGASSQLSVSIREITGQVANTTEITNHAQSHVTQTTMQIEGLANAADSIGQVIGIIGDIANQTNLLALNATIEAARAGDAGKGFTVVASEVKKLANQTVKATEEISDKITAMQQETTRAVSAVGQINKVIGDVNTVTSGIASAVEEQDAATNAIAENIETTSCDVDGLSRNITDIQKSLEMASSRFKNMRELTGQLTHKATDLKRSVENFTDDLVK